ncbi:MAG: hydrogenase maturation nickel metallochaperone HypA [Candidatus Jordarchaeaceae archaeon]
MHELSTVVSIVETVTRVAEANNVKKVLEINVEIGQFTFVNPEQLKFLFEIASNDTPLKNSKLNITLVPGKLHCNDCGYSGDAISEEDQRKAHLLPLVGFSAKCPICNSSNTEIIGGRELNIKNIKAEVDEVADK